MAIKGIFYVFAHVSDLARSKKFFGETLGWKLGTDEKEVAGFAFGGGYLVLHAGEYGESALGNGGMHVEVQVEDVDAEHARLKNLGLDVADLTDQPWGERNFYFRDPDGYLWSYGQPTRAHR
jgi:catechol 2,3-dioxygenase-like lactoylglutathione lyase family enzyme